MIATTQFSVVLWGMAQLLRITARRHPTFAERLKERNLVAQIIARDEEVGRWYKLDGGKLTTGGGRHAKPDVTIAFKNARMGADLLTPPINWLDQINAIKDFNLVSWRYLGHPPQHFGPRVLRKLAVARGFMVYEGLR